MCFTILVSTVLLKISTFSKETTKKLTQADVSKWVQLIDSTESPIGFARSINGTARHLNF